jgi:hypothetical protein
MDFSMAFQSLLSLSTSVFTRLAKPSFPLLKPDSVQGIQHAIHLSSILPVAQARLLNYGVPANLVARSGPLWASQCFFLFTLFLDLPGNTLLLRTCVPPPRAVCSKEVPTSGRGRCIGH